MKIVVLSPHRDDAAFSLSLAIAAWLKQGNRITVLNCFTRSDYAPYSDAASIHPNDRMSYVTALRLREDVSWQRHFGPHLLRTELNLKDAPLRLHCSADEVCSLPVNPHDKALFKIRAAIEQLAPDALVIPLALGAHVDHLTARDAALPLYSDTLPFAFYEDLPYAARPGAADLIESLAHTLAPGLHPVFAEAPTDPSLAQQRKRTLALSYDSQIDDDVTEQIAAFCLNYDGRERLWANPAWHRSSLSIDLPV